MVTKAEPRILVRATSLNSYLNHRDAGSLQHSLLNLTTTTTASCIAFNVLYPHIARTKYTIPQMQLSSEIMRHLPTCHTCTYIAFSGEYFLGRPSVVGTIETSVRCPMMWHWQLLRLYLSPYSVRLARALLGKQLSGSACG